MKRPNHLDTSNFSLCPTGAGYHEPLMVDSGMHVKFTSAPQSDDEEGKPAFYVITTVCMHCGQFYTRTEDVE